MEIHEALITVALPFGYIAAMSCHRRHRAHRRDIVGKE